MKKTMTIILSVILVLAIIVPAGASSTILVKNIKLSSSKVSLKVSESYNIKVNFTPTNTTQKTLTYVSDNKKIAAVDTTGKIIGVNPGTTTITVYTVNKKIFAKCMVNVSKLAFSEAQFKQVKDTVKQIDAAALKVAAIKVNSVLLSILGLGTDLDGSQQAGALIEKQIAEFNTIVSGIKASMIDQSSGEKIVSMNSDMEVLSSALDKNLKDMKAAMNDKNTDNAGVALKNVTSYFSKASDEITQLNALLNGIK